MRKMNQASIVQHWTLPPEHAWVFSVVVSLEPYTYGYQVSVVYYLGDFNQIIMRLEFWKNHTLWLYESSEKVVVRIYESSEEPLRNTKYHGGRNKMVRDLKKGISISVSDAVNNFKNPSIYNIFLSFSCFPYLLWLDVVPQGFMCWKVLVSSEAMLIGGRILRGRASSLRSLGHLESHFCKGLR
jgi:hypothetical protein